MLRRLALVGLLVVLSLPLAASAQEAPSLQALQARYDRLQGLQAAFTQVTSSEFANGSTQLTGSVLLAGNKYRVETPAQTVVTNGTTTWIYSPADSQVVVNDADAETSTITPQAFLTTSAEAYNVTSTRSATRGGTPHHVVSLSAAGSSARFKEATLWVRRSDQIITRLRATDRNGATLDLRLRDIVVDPSLDAATFSFSAPRGVEVVDLRPDGSN